MPGGMPTLDAAATLAKSEEINLLALGLTLGDAVPLQPASPPRDRQTPRKNRGRQAGQRPPIKSRLSGANASPVADSRPLPPATAPGEGTPYKVAARVDYRSPVWTARITCPTCGPVPTCPVPPTPLPACCCSSSVWTARGTLVLSCSVLSCPFLSAVRIICLRLLQPGLDGTHYLLAVAPAPPGRHALPVLSCPLSAVQRPGKRTNNLWCPVTLPLATGHTYLPAPHGQDARTTCARRRGDSGKCHLSPRTQHRTRNDAGDLRICCHNHRHQHRHASLVMRRMRWAQPSARACPARHPQPHHTRMWRRRAPLRQSHSRTPTSPRSTGDAWSGALRTSGYSGRAPGP
jgi:hypothetical protein